MDVTVTGSQKGLMLPPGLGFVFFNARAAAARAGLPRVSKYWDWAPRAEPEMFYQYFGGTAPTHHLYGLRAALDMIHAEGIEAVWARHERLARAIWAACEVWGRTARCGSTCRTGASQPGGDRAGARTRRTAPACATG